MSCTRCYPSPCSCTSYQPAAPLPVAAPSCAPPCYENHEKVVINQCFSSVIRTKNAWVVPEEGEQVSILVPGLCDTLPGSYIWSSTYGYFKVILYDTAAQTLTVQNEDTDGNANAGTQVLPGSPFIFVDPPCCTDATNNSPYPYVAVDFTVPGVGLCVEIEVTSVATLAPGQTVQIQNGTYLLDGIVDGTHIAICNVGDGDTPGNLVVARDAGGNFQVPIIPINLNACDETPIDEGVLLVCGVSGAAPLDGEYPGQTIFLRDSATNEASYGFPGADERLCTLLTADLNLISGTANYVLEVASSAGFVVGDIVQVNFGSFRFEVTGVPDGTHLNVTASPVPGANSTISSGTYVCKILATEVLQNQIDALTEGLASDLSTPLAPGTLTVSGTSIAGNNAEIVLVNPSPIMTMVVIATMDVDFDFNVDATADPSDCQFVYQLESAFDIAPIGTSALGAFTGGPSFSRNPTVHGPKTEIQDTSASSSSVYQVGPGDEVRIGVRGRITLSNVGSADGISYSDIASKVSAIGVAVVP